jgi:hypothetical protein
MLYIKRRTILEQAIKIFSSSPTYFERDKRNVHLLALATRFD